MPPVLVDNQMSSPPSLEDLVAFGNLKKNNDRRAVEIYSAFEKTKDEAAFHKAMTSLVKGGGKPSRHGGQPGQPKDKMTNQREGKSHVNSQSNSNPNAGNSNPKTNRSEKRTAKRSSPANAGSALDDKPTSPLSESSSVDGIAEMKEGEAKTDKKAPKGPMSWAAIAIAPAPVKVAEPVIDVVDTPTENGATTDNSQLTQSTTNDKKEKKKSPTAGITSALKTDEEKKVGKDSKSKVEKRKASKSPPTLAGDKEKPAALSAPSWASILTAPPPSAIVITPPTVEDIVEGGLEESEAVAATKRDKKSRKNKKDGKDSKDGKETVAIVSEDSEVPLEATEAYKNEQKDVKSNKNKKEKKEKRSKNEDKVENDIEELGAGAPPGIPPGLPTAPVSLNNDDSKAMSKEDRSNARKEKDRVRRAKKKTTAANSGDSETPSTILDLKEEKETSLEGVTGTAPATTTDIFFGDASFDMSFDLNSLDLKEDKEANTTSTVPAAPQVVAAAEATTQDKTVPVVPVVKAEDTLAAPPGVTLSTQSVAPTLTTPYTNTATAPTAVGNTYKQPATTPSFNPNANRGPPAAKKDDWSNPYPVKSQAALSNLHPATFSDNHFYQPNHSQINQSMSTDPMTGMTTNSNVYGNMDTNPFSMNSMGNTMGNMGHYNDFSTSSGLQSIDLVNGGGIFNSHTNTIPNAPTHHSNSHSNMGGLMSEDLGGKKSNSNGNNSSSMSSQAQQFQQLNNINNSMVSNNTGLVGQSNSMSGNTSMGNNMNNMNGLWSQQHSTYPVAHPGMGMMGGYDMNMMNLMGHQPSVNQQAIPPPPPSHNMGAMGQQMGGMPGGPGFDFNSQYMQMQLLYQQQMAQLQYYQMQQSMQGNMAFQQPGTTPMAMGNAGVAPVNVAVPASDTTSTTASTAAQPSFTTTSTSTTSMEVPALTTSTDNTLLTVTSAVETTEINLTSLVEGSTTTTAITATNGDNEDTGHNTEESKSKKRRGKGKKEGKQDAPIATSASSTAATNDKEYKKEKASKSTVKTEGGKGKESEQASKPKTTKVAKPSGKKDPTTTTTTAATTTKEGAAPRGNEAPKGKKTSSNSKGKDLLSLLNTDAGKSKPSKSPFA